MEFCPHGARIVLEDGKQPIFLDECEPCITLLADLGFTGKVVPRTRETATSAA
jgi:hypothetical protein